MRIRLARSSPSARLARLAGFAQLARRGALALCGALLIACTAPPAPAPEPAVDLAPVRADAPTTAPSAALLPAASESMLLQPLQRQAPHPADAAPRSQVAAVTYDLFGGSASVDDPLDDRAPGNGAPRAAHQRGGASWYGQDFHNRKTANGERFDMGAMTAAHRSLPFGSRVCVRSLVNGKEVMVRVNDRGPFAAGRIIDLSRAAASTIDMIGLGIKQVSLTLMDRHGARCGESDTTLAPGADELPLPAERRASQPQLKSASRRR